MANEGIILILFLIISLLGSENFNRIWNSWIFGVNLSYFINHLSIQGILVVEFKIFGTVIKFAALNRFVVFGISSLGIVLQKMSLTIDFSIKYFSFCQEELCHLDNYRLSVSKIALMRCVATYDLRSSENVFSFLSDIKSAQKSTKLGSAPEVTNWPKNPPNWTFHSTQLHIQLCKLKIYLLLSSWY